MLMRLFIACEIPYDARKKLFTLQKIIGEEDARIKWVEQDNIHLTIKFLGEVNDENVDGIRESLLSIKSKPIEAHLSGFGVFPSESYIRVLWVGLEPAAEIEKLHREIDDALSGLGFKHETRFQTHVTLGRVRSVRNKEGLVKKILKLKCKGTEIGESFKIDCFKLKKSTLTPQGPVYEDVASVSLA